MRQQTHKKYAVGLILMLAIFFTVIESPRLFSGPAVDGNKVLRGVNLTYFMDVPNGAWMRKDGTLLWNVWDTAAIGEYLDGMKGWGINCIRTFVTAEWWIHDTAHFQNHIAYFLEQTAQRGISVIFTFWRISSSGTNGWAIGLPYPPYWTGNANDLALMPNAQTFIDLWRDVATKLKDHNNVIFEPFNEPNGYSFPDPSNAENSWFATVQQIITAIRATGATNTIDIPWDGPINYDFVYNKPANDWSWITHHPLTDPADNLMYDMHAYSYFMDYAGLNLIHTREQILTLLTETQTLNTASQKRIMIGEIGCNMWKGDKQPQEIEWFNNMLDVLNENNIGYCVFVGWTYDNEWTLVNGEPNYAPNEVGEIFLDHLR